MTELNDELLVAYVDGQLATAQSKAIERVLEEDEVAAQRVEALRAANTHLETAFEAMIAGEPIPVPASELDATGQKGLHRRLIQRIAHYAFAAWVGFGCLIAGAAGGFIFYDQIRAERFETAVVAPPPPTPAEPPAAQLVTAAIPATWADDMVKAHALLSSETFSFGLESEGNIDLTGFRISKVLGTNMLVPDLSGQELTFQRAQVLQRDGQPFAQIAYLTKSGDPVALYATMRTGEPEAMKLGDKDGIGFAIWTQGELSLLLAGNLPDERLGQIARFIEHDFASSEPRAQDTGAPIDQPVPETVGGPDEAADGTESSAPANQ